MHKTRTAAAMAAALSLAAVPVAEAAPKQKASSPTVKVMTRNIYLGGNIFLPIATHGRAPQFEQKAGELWDQVETTNFPRRAKLLAREIKRHKPDLIGLQEVALWRRGPQGVKDGSATPATQVVYDFKKTLLRELKRAGLKYRVGDTQREADIEASIDRRLRRAAHDVRRDPRKAQEGPEDPQAQLGQLQDEGDASPLPAARSRARADGPPWTCRWTSAASGS